MKKVLVVDDDIVMFRLFQIQVKRAACEGFFFQEGKAALEQFESIKPDLAVLDFNLPDIDGATLFRQIKELPSGKDIPIVFVTGTIQRDELEAIKTIGADAYLSKPFSPRKLQNLIKEFLAL